MTCHVAQHESLNQPLSQAETESYRGRSGASLTVDTVLNGNHCHLPLPGAAAKRHCCFGFIVKIAYCILEKKRKVYAVRRYNGSFCTQKQPESSPLHLVALLDLSELAGRVYFHCWSFG